MPPRDRGSLADLRLVRCNECLWSSRGMHRQQRHVPDLLPRRILLFGPGRAAMDSEENCVKTSVYSAALLPSVPFSSARLCGPR